MCDTFHISPNMIELPIIANSETIHVYNNVLYRASYTNAKVLQKSSDAGLNWTNLYTFEKNVGAIVVCENGNILVPQDSDGYWAEADKTKWYLSTDGGSTFGAVLTYNNGGVAAWSFDVKGNEIVVGEYGTYDSIYVYYSNDGGATWSTIFTQPTPASGDVHIHKVLFDPYLDDTIYVSNGDSATKSVWWTQNNGSTWGQIPYHQPTWMEVDETYLYLFGDLNGLIHRIPKTNMFAGTYNQAQEIVYDASQDPEGEFGNLSFYAGRIVGNYIFAGGVAYGENNASNNNKDACLLVSWDNGENWRVVKTYDRNADSSSGASYISKPTSDGKFYIRNNNPNQTEMLDTSRVDFLALMTPLTRRGSTLTIKTS